MCRGKLCTYVREGKPCLRQVLWPVAEQRVRGYHSLWASWGAWLRWFQRSEGTDWMRNNEWVSHRRQLTELLDRDSRLCWPVSRSVGMLYCKETLTSGLIVLRLIKYTRALVTHSCGEGPWDDYIPIAGGAINPLGKHSEREQRLAVLCALPRTCDDRSCGGRSLLRKQIAHFFQWIRLVLKRLFSSAPSWDLGGV